jgi:hypothetical protein
MSDTINLGLKITAEAGQMKATVVGAQNDLRGLGTAAQAGAGQATTALQGVANAQTAVSTGAATASKATKVAADTHKEMAASAGNTAFAMRQLNVQFTQAAAGILSGQPVWMTLIQQGHQVADVAESTGIGLGVVDLAAQKVKTAFAALLSPIGLEIAGFAALGVAAYAVTARVIELEAGQRAFGVALTGTNRSSVASGQQLQDYARSLQRVGLDAADAQAEILALARSQGLSGVDLQNTIKLAGDLASALGIDVPTALGKLKEAFTGGYDGARKLDDVVNVLSASERDQVRAMKESGDQVGANKLIFEALQRQITGLNDQSLTQMSRALRDLAADWNGFMDAVAKSGAVIAAVQTLQLAVKALAALVPSGGGSGTVVGQLNAQIARLEAQLADRDSYGQPTVSGAAAAALQQQIANLKAQAMLAGGAITGDAANAPATPTTSTTGAAAASTAEQQRQAKVVSDATKAWDDQRRILAASLPDRARVRAEIEAENAISGLNVDAKAAEEIKRRAVTTAIATEADARAQELLGIDLEITAAKDLVAATTGGRVAMLQATAAAQAHAEAATKAGVSEEALMHALLNRAAAQAASQAASQVIDLEEAALAAKDLADATAKGFEAEHAAELVEKVRQLTVGLRAAAAAATDPALKALINGEVDRISDAVNAGDAAQQHRAVAQLGNQQGQDLDTLRLRQQLLGANAQTVATETADLRARQTLERQGISTTTEQSLAYRDQAKQIALTTQQVQQQEDSWAAVGQAGSQAFQQVGQQIAQDIAQGQLGFQTLEKVGTSVAQTLIQKFAELAIVNPLLNSLGLSGANLLPSLGSLISGGGGGVSAAVPSSQGALTSAIWHTGGVIGAPSATRDVPMSIFEGAPRFHTGGLIGSDEVPIIARKGEGVFTPEQMSAMGPSGGIVINANFNGNVGSANDRALMAAQLHAVVDDAVNRRTPGIAALAQAGVIAQAGRGGKYAQAVGRRS